jgi:murein L,D-transpeptidase YcbB/YkuD
MTKTKILVLFLFVQTLTFGEALSLKNISSHIRSAVGTHLKGQNKNIVKRMYARTNYNPIWITVNNKKKMSQLILALKDPLFNYKNKAFDQKSVAQLFFQIDNAQLPKQKLAAVYARIDLMLSNSFVGLTRFLVQGDVDWEMVQAKLAGLKKSDDIKAQWEMSPKSFPNRQKFISTAINGGIYPYLTGLIPMEKRYRKLIKLLKSYRLMSKFPTIPYTKKVLEKGDRAGRIELIKQRLQISGDYPKDKDIDSSFDSALVEASLSYQKRYLLKENGKIDKTMTYYLNQPVKNNIQAIITNLDKTKLYAKRFENEYVEVNVPDFNLRYYKDDEIILKTGLVVGRIDRPTPLFHNAIRYLVLNPTWTIPDNLIKRDLIHVLRENPKYLEENNIHVFSGEEEVKVSQAKLDRYENSKKRVPYRFVQFPGDNNALGRVKFMFPNKYAVYLHDTDNKSLFPRRYKVYSSGCMRVEHPFDLADTLLEHSKVSYSRSAIEKILKTNKPTGITLTKPIPVHILYFTVYEEDGLAYFKNDIYLYDKIIEESVQGHKKLKFKVPNKRMVKMKKSPIKPLSN